MLDKELCPQPCRELCPIARPLEERTYQTGKHPGRTTTYVLITTIVDGVSVTALEDKWHRIVRTQIPENAQPICNITERIENCKHNGGQTSLSEYCIYIPGHKALITVGENLSRHNKPSDITNSALLAKHTHQPVPQSETDTAVVFGSLGMAHVAPDARVVRQK